MPPVGFETISAGERPQTYALDPRGHWARPSPYSAVFYWEKDKVHFDCHANNNDWYFCMNIMVAL